MNIAAGINTINIIVIMTIDIIEDTISIIGTEGALGSPLTLIHPNPIRHKAFEVLHSSQMTLFLG